MRTIWMLAITFLLVACGSESGSPSAATPADPDQPVSVPASSGPAPGVGGPSPVTPIGQTLDPHKVAWTKVTPSGDGHTLTVVWWSGVEPCYALDRVEAHETDDAVTVTVYEGRDKTQPDAACIEIAVEKSTEVPLKKPLDGRKVVDGAR
ncbi:hypothetical protein J5X84_06765 [Streptosporangiaceae bacterium NEAU-GS5]|nr:hypothetical protein [Streptosporangiaceae bacterium NEAU-GS5]